MTRRRPNAFTLIETLIAVALFAAMMAVAAGFFFRFATLSGYQSAFEDAAGSGSRALEQMQEAMRAARRVSLSHVFAGVARASSADALVLELPSVDASGALLPGASDYEAFYASGGALYRDFDANASSARVSGTTRLSDALTTLSFAYGNADLSIATTVSATLSTGTTTRAGTVVGGGTITVRLRNL